MGSQDPNSLLAQAGHNYAHFDQRNESPTKLDFVTQQAADKAANDEAMKYRNQKAKAHQQSKSQDNAVKGKQQRQMNYYSADNSQRESPQVQTATNMSAAAQSQSPSSKRKSPTKRQDVLLNTSLNQIYVKEVPSGGQHTAKPGGANQKRLEPAAGHTKEQTDGPQQP